MKKVIKILKNNMFGIILGIIISGISVYAVENIAMIDSEEVTYNNTESHGDYDNVQETIDELYMKVGFTGEKWIDPILHGADPELKEGLIPVVISSKGDTYYANEHTRWYDYSQKRWANAVILVDNAKDKYKAGEKIEEQDIESYFVWIPRYKYKIWDTGNYTSAISGDSLANIKEDGDPEGKYSLRKITGNARVIEIEFESKSATKQSGNAVNQWLTHPAFTLGSTELNGFWVGKFETGYNQDGDNGSSITPEDWNTKGAEQNSSDSKRIIIKPNVYSWRGNTVKNFFMSAYKYKQELKSHMMKNTEWGAVAYLSHSSYGIGGEININNNNTYKTGYSSYNVDQSMFPGTESTGEDGKSTTWNTPTGFLASTTGNITGVYDMSGGSWESVAAYRVGTTDITYNKSGFSEDEITTTYKDYIDQYPSDSSTTTYNKRILGDATGELGPFFNFKDSDGPDRPHNCWYTDYSIFIDNIGPWFERSGNFVNGSIAGQFLFSRYNGGKSANDSFRLVLSI